MGFRLNPLTGQLDMVGSSSSGSGDVSGPASSDDRAITRFDGVTGKVIQNSPGTYVQDGGAVQAQGFITNRSITNLVVIPANYSWVAPSLELELGGSIQLETDGEIIMV